MHANERGATILIVEDDANTLHSMRDYLQRANFQVVVAVNGWDAMKRMKESPVDLVISELLIADMDGASLREKMMLNPDTRDIPFFFLVPEGNTDVVVRALRSGVDECLTRPFDPVVLVARVQAVLERRRAYEQMVRVDPLTRMLNRPTLETEVVEELSRVERYKRFGSMVLLEPDNFAKVSEESGAAMGDLLLTCLSGVILTQMRNVDKAGRFRGNRILVYMPETDEEGAVAFSKRMQEKLSKIADNVAGYALTFSCGVVTTPADGSTVDVLFQRVARALEHARERNPGGVTVWRRDVAESESGSPHSIADI